MESNNRQDYKIGDTVYVKPNDFSSLIKGTIVDFQAVGNYLPIVEFYSPYKKSEKVKNAFNWERISKSPKIKLCEWRIVETTYTYEGE